MPQQALVVQTRRELQQVAQGKIPASCTFINKNC